VNVRAELPIEDLFDGAILLRERADVDAELAKTFIALGDIDRATECTRRCLETRASAVRFRRAAMTAPYAE
jgi:hypothetical protein